MRFAESWRNSPRVTDPRPRRLAAFREALSEAHLDGLLLTSLPNIRYLTGFSGSSALAVMTARDALLITDFRYAAQVRDEAGDVVRTAVEPQSLWLGLWRMLPHQNVRVLGFESAHVTHRDFARLLESGANWQWQPTADLVERLRERKDADEIGRISAAVNVAEQALADTLPRVRTGMTETAVAGLLEHALRSHGSESYPFATIVASGPRSALPHARSSTREARSGELLLIDFGAVVDGYCADITRTVVIGRATEEQRSIHAVVREANRLASAGVRPGMRGMDADALARSYIEAQQLGDAFGHSLGHGLGLEVHESPRLARTAEAVLPVGAVVTIEPGVYREGWGGVRIEDDVVLEPDGARILSSFTRDLLEIG